MKASSQIPLSLLHISDLHFLDNGRPEYVGHSQESPQKVAPKVGGDDAKNYLAALRNYLSEAGTQDSWPKVVIVNGDLVEKVSEI